MHDPKLDQEIRCADTCAATLKQYYDLVKNAIKQEVVTSDSEETFVELLKRMPDDINAFYKAVDLERTDKRVSSICETAGSLHEVVHMPHFQQETLLGLCHAEFMDIFYYRGSLLYRQERVQQLNLMNIQIKRLAKHPITIILLLIISTYLLLMTIF